MIHEQRCEYLSLGGMSVMCLDSYCPSRHACDHIVKPSCWGASHSSAVSEREKVLDIIIATMNESRSSMYPGLVSFDCVFKKIQSLRQGKDGE